MIHKFIESGLVKLNPGIMKSFLKHKEDSSTRKTHHFGHRFENIYIDKKNIPGLDDVLKIVLSHAADITGHDKNILQIGYWFNHMQPGDQTLAHSHDDDNEILSCVYYVSVPVNSGALYVGEGQARITINPRESMLVFFNPDIVHSVGINESKQNRLSIGMNIGVKNFN